jgi:hypothetical protein
VRSQSKKFDREVTVERVENRCKANALPWAGEPTQPEQQRFTLRMRARSWTSRSIFLLRTRAGFVALANEYYTLDRFAWRLPRSPESGVAVSMDVKSLSRGKRKISLDIFLKRLFVVVVFHGRHTAHLLPRVHASPPPGLKRTFPDRKKCAWKEVRLICARAQRVQERTPREWRAPPI